MEADIATYDASQRMLLNFILGAMIFGLSLDIRPRDFLQVIKSPRAPAAGLIAQFLFLPAATFFVTIIVDLHPAIELGMMLVASCPGGAISNFITLLARGNVALSLSMTAASSLLAIILLPINFTFWASLNPDTAAYLQAVEVDGVSIFKMLLIVLAVPLALGQLVRHWAPSFADRVHKTLKPMSIIVLLTFVVVAVSQNWDHFLSDFALMFTIVFFHNALAFMLGYISARIGKLHGSDARAVTIEVGIQNSSLAMTIIFSQFAAESNMLLIAAFWGTWHIISGFVVAIISQYLLRRTDNSALQAKL